MKKLYTLQECFEACGSKFPFEIDYYRNGDISKLPESTQTIVMKKHNDHVQMDCFFTERSMYWSSQNLKEFDFKRLQYNKDFDKLINEEKK